MMTETVRALLTEAVDVWAAEFDADEPVNGGDLVDWFGGWRQRLKAALGAVPAGEAAPVPADHVCPPESVRRLYDARGIYCGRVCDVCEEEKRGRYRPEIFSDPAYEHDEPIEEE